MHEYEPTTPAFDEDETAQFPKHLIRPVEALDSEQEKKELETIIHAIDAAEKEADQGIDNKTSSE